MHLGKILPPAASPLNVKDLSYGLRGLKIGEVLLKKFSMELQDIFGSRHVSLISSGRAALVLALQALQKLAPGRNKVIIPAYTCWSVPAAVVRAGLSPVPCDVAANCFDYDFNILPQLLEPGVLCVISQHLFGVPADIPRLSHLLSGSGIFIVEDAAQAMGGVCSGHLLGTLADVGLFSLGRGKNLSTVEGGILITQHADISAALLEVTKKLKRTSIKEQQFLFLKALGMYFFLQPQLFRLAVNLPSLKLGETFFDLRFSISRMGGVQAGLANDWISRLESFRQIRGKNIKFLIESLPQIKDICPLPVEAAGNGPRLPIFISDDGIRELIISGSFQQGLGLALTYPDSVDGIPYFRVKFLYGSYPQAHRLAKETVTLPIHPFVTASDLERVISLLRRHLKFN